MKENPKYILLIQKKSRKTKKGTKTDKIESKMVYLNQTIPIII